MKTQRFKICVVAIAALCVVTQVRAEDGDSPLVCRTFAFFAIGSDLGPDYFFSDDSLAVVVVAQSSGDAASDDLHFAPCPEHAGALADTTWVIRTAIHSTKGNHWEVGHYYWLLTEETPEPPPEGVMTLTGSGSPLILSQELIYVNTSDYFYDCPELLPGDLVTDAGGAPLLIVTALFNR